MKEKLLNAHISTFYALRIFVVVVNPFILVFWLWSIIVKVQLYFLIRYLAVSL